MSATKATVGSAAREIEGGGGGVMSGRNGTCWHLVSRLVPLSCRCKSCFTLRGPEEDWGRT